MCGVCTCGIYVMFGVHIHCVCDVWGVRRLWVMHGVLMTLYLRDKGRSLTVLYLPRIAVLQGWAWGWKRTGTRALAPGDVSSHPSPGM